MNQDLKSLQSTNQLFMVRPAQFESNEETQANNFFQKKSSSSDVPKKAKEEFDNYVRLLMQHGIQVTVMQDTFEPKKPDAVFPNNWFTTHKSGQLFYYPMFAPNRRLERSAEIKSFLEAQPGMNRIMDLSAHEKDGYYLEGTGSMVLDRVNKIVYACQSQRTSEKLLDLFCEELNYKKILFHGVDAHGHPIYHTNVMMGLGTAFAVLCTEAIQDRKERDAVIRSLHDTGHELVDITLEQVNHFAGNVLEVRNLDGQVFCIMSNTAYHSLRPEQVSILEQHANIIHPELHTIESNGGGSARCMVAELFTYNII